VYQSWQSYSSVNTTRHEGDGKCNKMQRCATSLPICVAVGGLKTKPTKTDWADQVHSRTGYKGVLPLPEGKYPSGVISVNRCGLMRQTISQWLALSELHSAHDERYWRHPTVSDVSCREQPKIKPWLRNGTLCRGNRGDVMSVGGFEKREGDVRI